MGHKPGKLHYNGDANGCCSTTLSDLPNDILQHIISKLPAVKTSILSKRWKSLWTSIGVLNIHQSQTSKLPKCHSYQEASMTFVENLLLSHNKSSLKEFHLSCEIFQSWFPIKPWIHTVVKRNVKLLSICLDEFQQVSQLPDYYRLPSCLFRSPSLTSLRLDIPIDLKLPSDISFPGLKVLELSRVVFVDAGATNNLLSSLALERSCIHKCRWAISATSIYAPKLQCLSIHEYAKDHIWKDGINVVVPRIEIVNTSLKTFSYVGKLLSIICINDSPHLAEARIDTPGIYDPTLFRRECVSRLLKMIKGISGTKNLTLSNGTLELLGSRLELHDHPPVPVFSDITNLNVFGTHLGFTRVDAIFTILDRSPCLTSVKFDKGIELSEYSTFSVWVREPVPSSFLSDFKKILFGRIILEHPTLSLFAKVISSSFKTANILEDMVIYCENLKTNNEEDLVKRKEILRCLLKLPKGFRTLSNFCY